ncbi:MAG: endonuclease III [Ignavibacteriales bacterium]|nr:endonuclease III [Ignavibacteriales bacterium]
MNKETASALRRRVRLIIARLRKLYPSAKTALKFEDPFQLLVSTVLSAQCTDARVNMVTPGLFRKLPTPQHFAAVNPRELEEEIRSTGFFRNKAKNIIAASKSIVEKFGGEVPRTMEELLELGGVGRKTANCVLGGAFGINEGIVVDTHVERLSQRLGLSHQNTAEKVERDLMAIVPREDWYDFSNLLILHGRNVCIARRPLCPECTLRRLCPSADGFMRKFHSQRGVPQRRKQVG